MDVTGAGIGIEMNGGNVDSTETGIMTDGAFTIAMGGAIMSGAVTGNSMVTTDTVTDLGFRN